jgi:hypothetical protein
MSKGHMKKGFGRFIKAHGKQTTNASVCETHQANRP